MNGILTVGANTLSISNPITIADINLITNETSGLTIDGFMPNIHIPSSVSQLGTLTINNSNLTVADGNVRVKNLFNLNNGFLNLGVNTLEIGQSALITGDIVRTGGAVRGTIKRWFANTTVSNKIFPLDNGFGSYSEANISFTGAPATGGSLTAWFNNSGSGQLPLGPNGLDYYIYADEMNINLVNLAPQYWTLTAGDGLAGFTYNLDLTGDGIPNVSNINYIALIKRSDNRNPWTWFNANFLITTGSGENPVLHFKGGTTFSEFGVGGNVDNLLPVELSSFTSVVAGRDVNLNWSTSMEQNNSGFDIERKSTLTGWSKIGNVEGHSTINTPSNYTYWDRNLSAGKFNYRLKQTDFNGNYKYYELSNEVIVGTPGKYSLAQNYPNPFNPATTISFSIPNQDFVSLKVFDVLGKQVAILVNDIKAAGFYDVTFNASSLSSGVYFYRLETSSFSEVKRMVVTK